MAARSGTRSLRAEERQTARAVGLAMSLASLAGVCWIALAALAVLGVVGVVTAIAVAVGGYLVAAALVCGLAADERRGR